MMDFVRGGVSLSIDDAGGAGGPVVFQHGLCGDARQTAEVFPQGSGSRRITVECRGHGGSQAGDPAQFSIATFADDIAAFIEQRLTPPVILGGISMGAAISSRLAVLRPDLVSALILARPAWVTDAAPENMAANAQVGRLLERFPPEEARRRFLASPLAHAFAAEAPDNLASLIGFFAREPIAVTAALLQTISSDGPGVSPAELGMIRVPTLVISHGRDIVHPLDHAEALARLIPSATLRVITAKADDRQRYALDFQAALAAFFREVS